MSDDIKKTITTAEFLSKFHKELVDGGLPCDLIHELVVSAGKSVFVGDGVTVRGGE